MNLMEASTSLDSMPDDVPDREVVARVVAGDSPLFEVLVRRYNQRVYRVARSIVGEQEAEDVMQHAYVRAFEHLRTFDGRSTFSTWVTKIAVYEALARNRKRRRLVSLPAAEALPREPVATRRPIASPRPASPSESAARRELRSVLRSAIERLPENLRLVFVLRDVEELDTAQTAETLGISPSNVKVRLHRARAMLRSDLTRALGAELQEVFSFHLDRCDRVVAGVFRQLGLTLDPKDVQGRVRQREKRTPEP